MSSTGACGLHLELFDAKVKVGMLYVLHRQLSAVY